MSGSIGPLGVRLAPYGRIREEEARAALAEQARALADGGADLLLVETQIDLNEATQAVLAARAVCSLPVAVSFTFTRDDRTLFGDDPATVARALVALGVDALGVNCSEGPDQVLRILLTMRREAGDVPLIAMPNAGAPRRLGGRILFQATPEYFAEHARTFARAGVFLVGGCCGTEPAHIAAMAEAITRPHLAVRSRPSDEPLTPTEETVPEGSTKPSASALARALDTKATVVVVEMDPPRGLSAARLVASSETLAQAGADAVSVADNPMARLRMSPWAACHLIQQESGIETILHFPTRGRNILRIQGDLLAAYALGVRNLFVCMGDPAAIGDYPEATNLADVTPSGLIALIKNRLNEGVDRAGGSIGGATSFVVGCALDLNTPDLEREARLLRRKVAAGADFALSQPVFSAKRLHSFLDCYSALFGPLGLPVLVGLLPLVNRRHAEFLHNEVPGIVVPDEVRARMDAAGSRSEEEGLALSTELGLELRESAAGIYLIPAFGRYDMAAELVEAIRS